MPLVQWNEQISVGVTQFDNDHKYLITLMNSLYDGINAGSGGMAVAYILEELLEYTETHFAREEAEMQRLGYPAYDEHKAQHDKLTQSVYELQRQLAAGSANALSGQAIEFLNKWLVEHIQVVDRGYMSFFNAHGLR
jgi:hemerythrin